MSLVYVNELRHGFTLKALLFLLFLNSQWLHIFWITDEYVVQRAVRRTRPSSSLPAWLAWVAILIDYLELPVIYDTLKRTAIAIRRRPGRGATACGRANGRASAPRRRSRLASLGWSRPRF